MRRVFFVVDLSLLRGPQRNTHLTNLISALGRVWAIYHQAGITFGYKLYDSSCGDCAVNHYLQRVASELVLPKRLRSSMETDLLSEDLPLLISLIDKATDDEFLESRKLRVRRTSRTAELPAQGLARALQAALGSSYLQKLVADSDSDNAEGTTEGLLLVYTPALGDEASVRMFVGSQSLESAGKLPAAFLQQVPQKLRNKATTFGVRFCWLSADHAAVDRTPQLHPLEQTLREQLFNSTVVLPAALAADPALDCSAFASLLGLTYEPEAASDGICVVHEMWMAEDPTIECFKALIYALDRPAFGGATGNHLQKLKLGGRKGIKKKTGADGDAQDATHEHIVKNARGQRLKEKAMRQRTASAAGEMSNGGATNTCSQQLEDVTPRYPACDPLTLEQAIEKVSSGLNAALDGLFQETTAPLPRTAGAPLALAAQKLVDAAFSGVLAHEAATSDPDDALEVSDIRIALCSRATIPAAQLKAQHAARVPYDQQCAFAWKCAGQVLLRLAIAAYTNPSARSASLDSVAFEEVLSLLQIIVATMQPIVVGGQDFFRFVVKPQFSATIAADVRRLEAALWDDEEEDDVDEDGGLTALRARAASLEKSGETPEAPGNKIAVADEDKGSAQSHGKAPAPRQEVLRQGGGGANRAARAVVPPARGPGGVPRPGRAGSQPMPGTASIGVGGGSQSFRSGEASGVHGCASGATAGTAVTRRTGSLPEADFLSRRYANSKQYSMQVKVPVAPQNNRAKHHAAVAAGGIKSHQAAPAQNKDARKKAPLGETSSLVSPLRNRKAAVKAVPDTPEDGAPDPSQKPTARGGGGAIAGGKNAAAPRKLFSPTKAIPPTPLDAIPNTTPRRTTRNTDGLTSPGGVGPSPLRQPQFGGGCMPGAIIPTSQEERNEAGGGAVVGTQMGMPAPRAAPQTNWFSSAIVPKGVQQARRAVPVAVAVDPVLVAATQQEAAVHKEQKKAEVEEPAAVDDMPMDIEELQAQPQELPLPAATEEIDIDIETMPTANKAPEVTKPSKSEPLASRGVSTRLSRGATVEPEDPAPAAAKKAAKKEPKPAQRRLTRHSAAATEAVEDAPAEEAPEPATKKKKVADSKAGKVEKEETKKAAPSKSAGKKELPPKKSEAAVEEDNTAAASQPEPRKTRHSSRHQPAEETETAAPAAPAAAKPKLSKKGGKEEKQEPEALPQAADAADADVTALPEPKQTRKRAREAQAATTATTGPAPTATATARPKRRSSNKSAATGAVAAQDKADDHAEVTSPAAPGAAPTTTITTALPEAVEAAPMEIAAEPAAEAMGFEHIMAAAVVVHEPAEHISSAAEEDFPSPSPPDDQSEEPAALAEKASPPSPPVLAPEAAAAMVSPAAQASPPAATPAPAAGPGLAGPNPTPSMARAASVLGKRTLLGLTGKTPATKRTRLGNMLINGAKPRRASLPRTSPSMNPSRMEIEDLGSPAKPSPYADDWALAASPPGARKKVGPKGKAGKAGGAAKPGPRGKKAAKNMNDALDAAADKDAPASPGDCMGESIGDAPVPIGGALRRMPKLGSLSPTAPDGGLDSDDEDDAMLQAAANGKLSPAQPQASPVKPAANASVLETTPVEAVATTPDSGRRKNGKKDAGAAANGKQQLHMSKLAALKSNNDVVIPGEILGVPAVGDEVKYRMEVADTFVDIHCYVSKITSFEKDAQNAWEVTVELNPLEGNSRKKFFFPLCSAHQKPWGAALEAEEDWSCKRGLEGSPIDIVNGGGGNSAWNKPAPAETMRHNAGARNQTRDSMDSVPVLPETAERLKAQSKMANEFVSPRLPRRMQLDMDQAVGIGSIPLAAAAAVFSTPAGATRVVAGGIGVGTGHRRDSISSSLGIRSEITPQARAAAERLLGTMYLRGQAQPSEVVEEQCAAAVSPARQWTTPSRPAVH